MESEYLTAEQAADKLQMHPRTIRRLLKDGQLPGVKIGARQWRISAKTLQEWVEGSGKPRTEPLLPIQSEKLASKAAADPKWKNKTTGAKKLAQGKVEKRER
jgi:excisionase family DNA binding protein